MFGPPQHTVFSRCKYDTVGDGEGRGKGDKEKGKYPGAVPHNYQQEKGREKQLYRLYYQQLSSSDAESTQKSVRVDIKTHTL
jgi:hypothetical protein